MGFGKGRHHDFWMIPVGDDVVWVPDAVFCCGVEGRGRRHLEFGERDAILDFETGRLMSLFVVSAGGGRRKRHHCVEPLCPDVFVLPSLQSICFGQVSGQLISG